jgi:nucleotide-binding universal stress UspA family protein
MDIKDILLLVSPSADSASATAAAAGLAKTNHAQVSAVFMTPLPSIDPSDGCAVGADAMNTVIDRMEREAEARAAAVEGPVRSVLDASDCAFSWTRTPAGEVAADTALRARTSDLVVMTRPDAAHAEARHLAESMVRVGGAPCLMTPQTASIGGFGRIVLAWNGSRQAKRAMDDAMPLLRAASVVDVTVVGGGDIRIRSEGPVVDHLHRHGVNAAVVALPRGEEGCAAALLDWCQSHDANLLVMGAFGRTPQAEHWLGGVTWTILTGAAVPVFMSC